MKHLTTKNKLARAAMTLLVALLGSVAVDSNCYAVQKRNISTYTKEITGYGDSENGRYYLIASPIDQEVSPEDVTNMTDGFFDLYYFDEGQEKEWINYIGEGGGVNGDFGNLLPGKGYLYANASQEDITLTFTGTPIDGDVYEVCLYHTGDAHWVGWNLVGNPFPETAYIVENDDFYIMNEDGDGLMPSTSSSINAMEGIFVYAEQDGQILTFTTTEPESRSVDFALTLSRAGHGIIDRTIIRFGESHCLPKLQLRKNSTKLFIKQDKQEFAVVSGDASCQMPVGFKAEHDGSYTISLSNSGVEFSYLHLVDLLTGKDIDLLAHPDYTFDARTTDDASRFRLDYTATNVANVQRGPFRGEENGGILLPQHGLLGNQDADNADDPEPQVMVIELTKGWNWFSTNIEITIDDLKAALVSSSGENEIIIKSQTENTMYNPSIGQWMGPLNTLDVAQMYMIHVGAACEFTLEGLPVDPNEHPVTIAPGYNWIAFPFNQSMTPANAFAGFAVTRDQIISKDANTTCYGGIWRGALNNLEPGKGYIYKSASTDERILVFQINQ